MKLPKFFDTVPKGERVGIHLDSRSTGWLIDYSCVAADFPSFIRHLGLIVTHRAVLYLEGLSIAPEVQDFLKEHRASAVTQVSVGTVWPKPKIFHVALEAGVLEGLAALAEKHKVFEICDHLLVYEDKELLLEGYDIQDAAPRLSSNVSEALLRKFCDELACGYQRIDRSH